MNYHYQCDIIANQSTLYKPLMMMTMLLLMVVVVAVVVVLVVVAMMATIIVIRVTNSFSSKLYNQQFPFMTSASISNINYTSSVQTVGPHTMS